MPADNLHFSASGFIFAARFVIEFVKERQVEFEELMKFNMGQLFSLPFILIGIAFISYGLSKRKEYCT